MQQASSGSGRCKYVDGISRFRALSGNPAGELERGKRDGKVQGSPGIGVLPKDKKKLLAFLDDVIKNVDEDELRRYRESVHHL